EACRLCAAALAGNARDIPFAMLYVAEPHEGCFSLVSQAGIPPGHPCGPARVPFESRGPWPISEVVLSGATRLITDLGRLWVDPPPSGSGDRTPSQGAILPILPSAEQGKTGALVVGLNPFRRFYDSYRTFLALVAGQIDAAISNAQAYEEERRHSQTLAE